MNPVKALGLFLIGAGFLCLWLLRDQPPYLRLAAASIGMIWVMKCAALLWQRADNKKPHSLWAMSLFLFAWPGISLYGFTERQNQPPPGTGARFLESWICLLLGTALLIIASLIGQGESTAWNYVMLLSILLIIHLGLLEVLADGLRLLGFSPPSLFDRPLLATSLRDFWSKRWNLAFVDMNKIFLLNPLRGQVPSSLLLFSIFGVSGLLHELGISYADGASWGRPLLYFLLQGVGMEAEKLKKLPRALVWIWIALPIPLLFTPHFTNLFLGGLGELISGIILALTLEDLLRYGLLAGGFAHLLVLCASVQVPRRLGWTEEFQKLRPLNRKVFWTYGGYIFGIIVFMAVVSFALSGSESLHSPAGRLWLAFIALFWWARVLTDFFYFHHADWPKGALFTIGHICLTTLFLSLAILYSTIGLLTQF